MDYAAYIRAFNKGDDAALVKTYFTQDCIFQSNTRVMTGADELLKFLNWAHDGIREIIRAQVVLRDENHLFAEIDMDFHATRDKPDFTFGALKQGEFTTVKFMVVYYLRDGKIAHLKAATWAPNTGVSKPVKRLGGTHEQRQAFMDYARAFSNADFDTFSQFYTEDVKCHLGTMLLDGRDAIVNFYRKMFQNVRESLTLNNLVADENGLCADIVTQFTAITDAPEFSVAPLKKGEFVSGRVFVYYTLRDGKICRITVARAGPMSAPQPL